MGYISNFTCAKCYFLYVGFSDSYVNQSLAGQTILEFTIKLVKILSGFRMIFRKNGKRKVICFYELHHRSNLPNAFQ
jgi:hypothetical protein